MKSTVLRVLAVALPAICGLGLLLGWKPEQYPWHVCEAVLFGLLAWWTAAWLAGRVPCTWSWLFLPLPAVAAWGGVQLALGWSVYRYATATDALRWATYAAALFLAAQALGGNEGWRRFRRAVIVYSLLLALVSVFQYFLGNGKIFWMFDTVEAAGLGPFLNRDHYSTFIALVLPIAIVEMVRSSRERWFFALATAALYASSVAGASRAGFVLLTLELVLLTALLSLRGRGLVAVLGLIVVFGLVVGWGNLFDRLRESDPYAGRREVAVSTVAMVKARPWRGWGLGTWTQVYPAYAEKDFGVFINAAHNDWLQWAADGGLPMAACLLLLAGGACALVRRVPWALGVPMAFLHCGIDFPMQGRFLPIAVFLLLGAAVRQAAESAQANHETETP